MKPIRDAALVFVVMLVLTIQVRTGFLGDMMEVQPRAVTGLDRFFETVFISWLGKDYTVLLLAALTLILPVFVYLKRAKPLKANIQSRRPAPSPKRATSQKPATSQNNRAKRAPDEKKLVKDLLDGAVAQVEHEKELTKANERPAPFVRLAPRVPLDPDVATTSWFGGTPRLPADTPWPRGDGKPMDFLAQIDCADLPGDLWGGAGPRSGWLVFFVGFQNDYLATTVFHTDRPGHEVLQPAGAPKDGRWFSEAAYTDWSELAQQSSPKWPVEIMPVQQMEDDPSPAPVGSAAETNPKTRLWQTGFDIRRPAHRPFDWPGTLLMIDAAAGHAEEWKKSVQRRITRAHDAIRKIDQGSSGTPDAKEVHASTVERVAALTSEMSGYDRLLQDVLGLRLAVSDMAESTPFTEAALETIVDELAALALTSGPDAEPICPFQPVSERESIGWLPKYAYLAYDYTKHLYASDPSALPPAPRRALEEQLDYEATREAGTMRDVPEGYVHDFNPEREVTLLELRTSRLMKWIWGDMYNLVLTIRKDDLAKSYFERVKAQITN